MFKLKSLRQLSNPYCCVITLYVTNERNYLVLSTHRYHLHQPYLVLIGILGFDESVKIPEIATKPKFEKSLFH